MFIFSPFCQSCSSRSPSLGGLKASQPKSGGTASSQQQHPEQDCFVHEPMTQNNMSQKGSQVDFPGKVTLHYIDLPVNVMQTQLTFLAMFKNPSLFSFWFIPFGPVEECGWENKGSVTKQN